MYLWFVWCLVFMLRFKRQHLQDMATISCTLTEYFVIVESGLDSLILIGNIRIINISFINLAGTPASVTQLAKDVCTFLKWTAGMTVFGTTLELPCKLMFMIFILLRFYCMDVSFSQDEYHDCYLRGILRLVSVFQGFLWCVYVGGVWMVVLTGFNHCFTSKIRHHFFCFLNISFAEPDHDDRKRMGMKVCTAPLSSSCIQNMNTFAFSAFILTKITVHYLQAIIILSLVMVASYYYKRHKWTVLKSRKIAYRPSPHSWCWDYIITWVSYSALDHS